MERKKKKAKDIKEEPVDLEPPRDRDGSFDPKMYCPYDKDIFTLCII